MENIIFDTECARLNKTFTSGLSSYTQTHCQCTLTDNGYRIYRTPNKTYSGDGSVMWGGLVLKPFGIRNNILQQYHRYVIMFHVEGVSSNAIADATWSNQVGWGGGGLMPSPSNIHTNMYLPANFNGERDCYYDFTINDSIYKVCTSSYSSFVEGNTYLSYNGFKFGFGYTDTGSLGTDLYITNIRLYDITSSPSINFNKNGIINTSQIEEIDGVFRIDGMCESLSSNFVEY